MLLVKFLALAAVAVAADCSSSPSPSSTSPPKPHATGALHPNNNDKAWCVSSSGTGINTGVLEGPVTLERCSSSVAQVVQLPPVDTPGLVMFGPNYQSLRVDRGPNVAAANGQKVKTIHPRYGSDNWVVTADRRVRLDGTNFCLDLTDGNKAAGNQLQIWTCYPGNDNQAWWLTPAAPAKRRMQYV